MPVGFDTLDFGSTSPGSMTAETVITGQIDIVAGSNAEAFLMYEDSADHTAAEHLVSSIRLACGDIVPGVGFTIHALSELSLNGTFKVRWVWA